MGIHPHIRYAGPHACKSSELEGKAGESIRRAGQGSMGLDRIVVLRNLGLVQEDAREPAIRLHLPTHTHTHARLLEVDSPGDLEPWRQHVPRILIPTLDLLSTEASTEASTGSPLAGAPNQLCTNAGTLRSFCACLATGRPRKGRKTKALSIGNSLFLRSRTAFFFPYPCARSCLTCFLFSLDHFHICSSSPIRRIKKETSS